MKNIRFASLMLVMVMFLASITSAQSSTKEKWTTRKALSWVKKKSWSGGWKVEPHSTINVQEFAWQYHRNKRYWDEAFEFLRTHNLNELPKGRHTIDSNFVYAIVTEDSTRDFDKTKWESHRKYIDLQYVIAGEEKIGVIPVAKAVVTKPYDESKDLVNYTADGQLYSATPAEFFLFFPEDAHRPGISPGGKKVNKKIVIKIRVTE